MKSSFKNVLTVEFKSQKIFVDLNSTITGASDAIHKRILNLGEFSNTNMDIDSYREINFPTKHSIKLPEDQLPDKSHGPTIFGR